MHRNPGSLRFVYIGIYWSNHHHMFQVVEGVNGTVLWGNLHLLFWLPLFPFTTARVDETTFSRTPVIVYGVNLLLAAIAYYTLQQAIFHAEGGSGLSQALGRDLKGRLTPVLLSPGHRPGLRHTLAGHAGIHRRGRHLARARPARGAVPRDPRGALRLNRTPGMPRASRPCSGHAGAATVPAGT